MADRSEVNHISGKIVMALSFMALLAVLAGFVQAPQADEGMAAHIFQISVVLWVPAVLMFLSSADWKRPSRGARPLAFPATLLAAALTALYYLEHYR